MHIESMPHYLVVSGHRRREERIHQECLQARFEGTSTSNVQGIHIGRSTVMEEQVEDEAIEEMLADFEATKDSQGTTHLGEEDQTPIHESARTPLYDGGSYSILRTCLELLNLQALYGWSNTSVTSLLK